MDALKNQISLGYKYDFEIKISSMKIEYKLPFNFRLLFKRGNKQTEIEKTFKYDPSTNSEININETFTISCIMKPENENLDISNPLFAEKKYKMYICIYTKTGFKPAISGEFNLAEFVSSQSKNKINEMILSNKTFTEIKIKYVINSSFVEECDMNQIANEVNQTTDFSKIDNQDMGVGNNVNLNTNKLDTANPNLKDNTDFRTPVDSNISHVIKGNVEGIYENSKKFEDRIPQSNQIDNPGVNYIDVDNLNINNAGSSNKIKLTFKTTTDSNNNNPTNLLKNNLISQNSFLDREKDDLNNTNRKFNEVISEEKVNDLRLTINKLQNKVSEEEKEKQDLMENQRKKDLEFISLVEENENMRIDIAKFKEQEILMLDEITRLKTDLENCIQENKESKLKYNSMLQKIDNLNNSISNLNDTIKGLKDKGNSTPSNQPSSTIANNDDLNVQLEEKDRIINEIRAENEYQIDEINLLKSVIEDLKKEKKQLFEEKNEQIVKLKNQIEESNNSVFEIKKSNEQNIKLFSELKNENKKIKEENEDLKNKKKELESNLKSEIENYKQKLREANKESQIERDQIYTKSMDELDTLKSNYNQKLDEKEAEIYNLRSLLNNNDGTKQLEKQGLENLIKNLNTEIQILEEKLGYKEMELQALKESEDKNIGGMKSDINDYLIAISQKDSQIKESKAEINSLTNTVNLLEEKVKILSFEKDGQIQNLMESERNLKDNIILYKQKLEEKDNYMQSVLDEKEKLKFECEKLRSEIKNAEKNKTNDEDLINQINLIQIKAAEKERKIVDEKDQDIRLLKKEIENIRQESKRTNANFSERENTKSQHEILYLKNEIENLKLENKEAKQYKDSMLKFEKTILDLQNNLAIKKVEISQSENEKEKQTSENRKIVMEINEQKTKIENLEKDLVFTKQKLGDVLNELSEHENNNTTLKTDKSVESLERKKTGFASFFSKKKKDC